MACLWRIRDGSRRIWGLTGFSFSTVAFRPDGEYFAARIGDIYLQIRDVRTGQLVVNHEIEGDSSYYFSTVFTPDGKGIANGGHNLQYWDVGFLARGNRDTGRDTKKVFESNIGQVRSSFFHSITTNIKPCFLYNRGLSPMSPSLPMGGGLFQAVGITTRTS